MTTPQNKAQPSVFWIIWFWMLASVVGLQFAIGKGIPLGANQTDSVPPIVWVSLLELLVATGIRWILIPRATVSGKLLVLMIIGLALSEGAQFLGLFLLPASQPQTKLVIWVLSILSILQLAPIYANRQLGRKNEFQGRQ